MDFKIKQLIFNQFLKTTTIVVAGLNQEGKEHTVIITHLSLGCFEWWETRAVSRVDTASPRRAEMQEGRVLAQGSRLAMSFFPLLSPGPLLPV